MVESMAYDYGKGDEDAKTQTFREEKRQRMQPLMKNGRGFDMIPFQSCSFWNKIIEVAYI
jgi:hypothetical protein